MRATQPCQPTRLASRLTGLPLLAAVAWFFGADATALAAAPAHGASAGLRIAASAAVALICGWLLLTALLAEAATLPGRAGRLAARVAARITPAVLRNVVILGVSAGVITPATQAAAATTGADAAAVSVMSTAIRPTGVLTDDHARLPDPSLRPDPDPEDPGRVSPPRTQERVLTNRLGTTVTPSPRCSTSAVTVAAGDTLWDIASRGLGPDAAPARVAVEWPRWFAANRPLLTDPDLLLPGQLLTAPTGRARS